MSEKADNIAQSLCLETLRLTNVFYRAIHLVLAAALLAKKQADAESYSQT